MARDPLPLSTIKYLLYKTIEGSVNIAFMNVLYMFIVYNLVRILPILMAR
jgi:hypothetical protein